MKRKVLSVLLSAVLVFSLMPVFKTTAHQTDAVLGDELVEILGCSGEELLEGFVPEISEPLPCVVWITDIDYETPVRTALQAAEATREDGGLEEIDDLYYVILDAKTGEKLVQVDMKLDEDPVYVQTYIETKRQTAKQLYLEQNTAFAEQWIDEGVTYISGYSPCVFADLSAEKIAGLLEVEGVCRIDYREDDVLENEAVTLTSGDLTNLQSKMELTNITITKQLYNVSGYNVKIGQIEPACPSITGITKHTGSLGSGQDNINHADNVYTIMHTIAPNATYYATGTPNQEGGVTGTFYSNAEWLLDQGVNIVNMSAGNENSNLLNTYTTMARWLDHIAFNHDVHWVNAAGNSGSSGVASPAMAYNIITVGNVTNAGSRYTGNSSGSGASSYNNECINTSIGKAFKPDLMAPGCYYTDSGTSYSAPMITGIIALMGNKWPGTLTKQHLVKSVLTTGTKSTPNCYISMETGYREYGAGILNARSAFYAINNSKYVELGTLNSTSTYTEHYFTVASTVSPVRVGLTYSNRIVIPDSFSHESEENLSEYRIADIIIIIYTPSGQQVTIDAQPYINVKIVEFDPAVYGTGTYRIRVQAQPSSDSLINPITRYSLSWKQGDL